MTWVKLDDKFHRNQKVLAMSDAGHRVYVDSLSFCGDVEEPNGYLSDEQAKSFLKSRGKPFKVIEELVRLNAWEQVAGGFLIHDFEKYLPKSSTERVRAWRAKKRAEGVTETLRNSFNGVTGTPRNGSSHARARATTGLSPSTTSPDIPDPAPEPVPGIASKEAMPVVRAALLRDAIQNGHTDDLALQYATRASELLGRTLSALEVSMCSIFLDDFAYLSVDDMLQRMHDHVEHCKANSLPVPRKLHGFRETLRLENEHRADARAPKAWRAEAIDFAHVIAQRDPDE